MAVYRPTPKCAFCGKPIARAIYKDYGNMPISMIPFGDSFIRWEFLEHNCPKSKEVEERKNNFKIEEILK